MKNILLKGSPGTGKTFFARGLAYYLCHKSMTIEESFSQNIVGDIDAIEQFIQGSRCEFIQVHPSMSYEDIVYGVSITANGDLSISYAEKRIKELCDIAIDDVDNLYCVIFDDIGRTNASTLLGDLLYAMEHRNQVIELANGVTLSIPDNVVLIFTECNQLFGERLDYALRRRMDYVHEFHSNKDVILAYYTDSVSNATLEIIGDIYDSVCEYVYQNFIKDPSISVDDYLPGHGFFMVDKNGTPIQIFDLIKQKIIYQVQPYLSALHSTGLIQGDIEAFFDSLQRKFNTGIESFNTVSAIYKIKLNTGERVAPFSLEDSRDYYSSIVHTNSFENKELLEYIIDAIILNGIFQYDVSLYSLLTNSNIARIQSGTEPVEYAGLMLDKDRAERFDYRTPREGSRVSHQYYSTRATCNRWKPDQEASAYKVEFADGSASKTYIPLNGFRCHNFSVDYVDVFTKNNAAEIYRAIYRLVSGYLQLYISSLSLLMGTDSEFVSLCQYIELEHRYLWAIHEAVKQQTGEKNKLPYFVRKLINIRSLWNAKDSIISVDTVKFVNLRDNQIAFNVESFEDLFSYSDATEKQIVLKGVCTMADLREYQCVMENIGVRQMIFQGPPGTSKTFDSKRFVLEQLNPEAPAFAEEFPTQEAISRDLLVFKLSETDYAHPKESARLTTGGWDLVQFHPSYGYEDFIRGIEVTTNNGSPVYTSVNRILGKIAEFSRLASSACPDNPPKFYLIIDEINRANLATVFGELIYGLEYRNSGVSTPYEVVDRVAGGSTKDIVLGKNLFIIGTMNTADKSIDSLDYAIRRRFIFIDSPANRDIVKSCYQYVSGNNDENSIELLLFDSVQALFEDERFFNSEYQKSDVRIGHTYFLRDRSTEYELATKQHFVYQVVPILREYVKDGILDSVEDLVALEHSIPDILSAPDRESVIRFISENLMLFIKEFGSKNRDGTSIDNAYVGSFIEDLRVALQY